MKHIIFVFTFLAGLTAALLPLYCSETSIKSNAYSEFSKMTSNEQRAFLVNSFKRRVEYSKNLHYLLDISTEIQQGTKSSKTKRTIENWILNKSYLMSVDIIPNNNTDSHQFITTSYDAKEGVAKGFVRLTKLSEEIIEGLIDTKEDTITKMNFYAAWHDASYFDKQFCIFHYLMQHQNDWQIDLDIDNELVNLTTDFAPHYETLSYRGKRLLKLDPSKGFLPIQSEARWDATLDSNVTAWEEHNFIVNKSEQIGNDWMPTEITQSFKASITPNNSTKIVIKILTIEQGHVTYKDVVCKFPAGIFVTDAINGISYKTDASGGPIESTIEPLYGIDPSQLKITKKKGWLGLALMTIGIIMIVAALYIQFRKYKNSN